MNCHPDVIIFVKGGEPATTQGREAVCAPAPHEAMEYILFVKKENVMLFVASYKEVSEYVSG